ncbi:hypothetical protein FRC04_005727, partial [Tulasnella sp. 424]
PTDVRITGDVVLAREQFAAPSRHDTLWRQSTTTSLCSSRSALGLLAGSTSHSQDHAITALASDPIASYVGTPSVASSASSVVNVSVDDGGSGMVVTGGDALEVEGELVVPSTTATTNGDVKRRFDSNVEEDADTIKRKDMTQRAKQDRSFSMVGGTETPINIASTAAASIRASSHVYKPR